MWRKLSVVMILALAAIFFLGKTAMAEPQTNNSTVQASQVVSMQGQASVVNGAQSRELKLKVRTADSGGWLLEVALDPTRVSYDSAGNQVLLFNGNYRLGTPTKPFDSGTASGWIDGNNSGTIQLSGKGNSSLKVTYSIAGDGTVSTQVQGTWPVNPALQSASTPAPAPPINHFFWYLSRTAGILAYILLFLNLCIGLGSRYVDRFVARWQSLDLHKFVGLLALGFLMLHVFSLLGDKYFSFTLPQLLVPFNAPYRTFWMGLGVIAFYMLILMVVTSYVRKHIGKRTWRSIHYLAFGLYFIALVHGIMAGTDTPTVWGQWLFISTGAATIFLFLWRFKEAIFRGLMTPASETAGYRR